MAAVILAGLTTRTIMVGYSTTLHDAANHRHGLVRIADAQISSHLRMVDNVLLEIREGVKSSPHDLSRLNERLKELKELFPFIYSMSFLDARGVAVLSTNKDAVGLDFSSRSYFQALSADSGDMFYVSEPVIAPRDLTILVTSRPVRADDGSFLGLVNITLLPDFFAQAMAVSVSTKGGAVLLAGKDGIVRMRQPFPDPLIGVSVSGLPAVEAFLSSGERVGEFRVVSGLDDRERFVSCMALDYPPNLVLAVSETTEAVLAGWRLEAFGNALFSMAGLALVLSLAFLAARSLDRSHRAERARLHQNALFSTLLRNLPVETWARDQAGRIIFQSESCIKVWGDLRGLPFDAAGLPEPTLRRWEANNSRAYAGETFTAQEDQILPDGAKRQVQTILGPLTDADGSSIGILGINIDITEASRTEEALLRSLREKEVMLREIHHRVKNNLQIILSLLNLQEETERHGDKPELPRVRDRILSMSLVHEHLYRSDDLSSVDMGLYVPALVQRIASAYRTSEGNVALTVEARDVRLTIERAIPLGLVINELVTNAFKYAFAGGRSGRLEVSLLPAGEGLAVLLVADDGPGMPPDAGNGGSLGLLLVCSLADQLGGEMSMDSASGTRCTITLRTH
ncbi:sensor histidine kinase [Fundidesulfovibrio magnetotacticus]|nr:histidine kinase dimerization/phosphoacceptor domain -containing protein [Fundidesulfovibrio magnetotacticus]